MRRIPALAGIKELIMGPTGFDSKTNGDVSMPSYGNDARKYNVSYF